METPDTNQSFRDVLKRELEERCRRNPKYSMRSFARDLGLAPARLSDVLRGRYGISPAAAESIAEKIGFSRLEASAFCDLVASQHARGNQAKAEAQIRLQAHGTTYHQVALDAFQVIADWYHYAILELCLVQGFKSDINWIASRLSLSVNVVKPALQRLERLDLIEFVDGDWRPTQDFTSSTTEIPSDAIKTFHKQILERALTALYTQPVSDRDFSGMVMAIDENDLDEAKKAIKIFRRSFDQRFATRVSKNSIYCLSTQFFRLDQKDNS